MFDFVRTHKKWMQILLALLIVPSFVVVGVSSYGSGGGAANEVANVGGQKITQQQFDEAQRRYIDNARAQMGERFDQKEFESAEAKRFILDKLVENAAIDAEIKNSHMTVGDASIQKNISEVPSFRKADGSFDLDKYKALLGAQNMSPLQYEHQIRTELTKRQLGSALPGTAFVPRSLATRLSDLGAQEREVQEVLFKAADFADQVKVTDDMVKAYYDKNATLFQAPEQVKVEYVVLNAGVVEGLIAISDADAQKVYDASKDKFTAKETRAVSHILVAKKDAAADKAKAEALLAEVRKAPASFAAVAKAKSDDPASAEQGGTLGSITVGGEASLASAEVEAAAAKLKEGEAELVQSEFGYHIVTVTKINPAAIKPFEAVKGEIVAELKKAQMSKKYSELAEQFTNIVYEQSDSLKPVADKLKLPIQTIDNLKRDTKAGPDSPPVYSAKFLKAIFSNDALKNKRNTEAVEVAPATLVAGRVVDYKPAAKRPLAEVADAIRKTVVEEEAEKLARKAGEAKIAAAKAAGDAEGFGATKSISRNKQPEVASAAVNDLMKADVTKLPAYVGVNLPGVGYGVYRINKVTQPAETDLARRGMERQQFDGMVAQQESYAYLNALKTKAKTKVSDKPLTKTADAVE
ncbi:SurA N-terminal domain-containing protein [Massilia sp. CF038]|uniref:SurA N-terminal domain-containing protein n=1 Tax=Massilia sp. CF038 TaxID=1881045 RepID=UPI000921692A|nr:SurA N-terminal domain-containing protein [Massilia sp. CF038]SHG77974.1 peptidyl-prolyl cis-trans isomerase D [Massilia sp. CF038]